MKESGVYLTRKGESEKYSIFDQHSSSHVDVLHWNTMSTSSLLTPPITPQVGAGRFKFNSNKRTVGQVSESEVEGLALTPSDSEVFT